MLYEVQKARGFRQKDINKMLNALDSKETAKSASSQKNFNENDMTEALSYVGIFPDTKRKEMILNAPFAIRHIFDRIAEIILCEREQKAHERYMANADEEFYSTVKDPGGELTVEQMNAVKEFWEPYEFFYKNDPKIQRIFTTVSGRFDASYIPWSVYRFTRRYWGHAIDSYTTNKNFTQRAFPDVKKAKAVVRYYGGNYYNSAYEVITLETACQICFDYLSKPENNDIIVKQTGGGEGEGITFLRNGDTIEDIKKVFISYNQPFIAEEIVISHDLYAEPHPQSLNTLRVLTVSYNSEIYITAIMFRMGVGDSRIDNVAKGGLIALVNDDGELSDYALDLSGNKFYQHPGGYVFAGKKLPYVDRVIETAKRLHSVIPQLRCIGWDFAVDGKGDAVLIELNPIAKQFSLQLHGKHTFINSEIAKELLDDWILKQFSYRRASWNWDYREYYDHIELTKYAGLYKSITLPEKMDGKPVTVIRDGAFTNTMNSITVPSSIKTIGKDVFTKVGTKCKIIKL